MQPPLASLGAIAEKAVVVRDLDGFDFLVLVLRITGSEADVIYLDDGNLERGVPVDELAEAADDVREEWTDVHESRWNDGLASLLAETHLSQDAASRPTTASMRWEEGRYQAEDGSLVLSAEYAAGTHLKAEEPPAATAAAPPCAPPAEAAPPAAAAPPIAVAGEAAPAPPAAAAPVAQTTVKEGRPVVPACGAGLRGIRNLRRNRHAAPDCEAPPAPLVA